MVRDDDSFPVDVFDEEHYVTLEELCRLTGVQSEVVIELVQEGVLEPVDIHASHWSFSGNYVRHVRIAGRLQRDLEVNTAGVALVLELLEELEQLRRRL